MRRFLGLAGWIAGMLTFGTAVSWAINPDIPMHHVAVRVALLWVMASFGIVSAAACIYLGYEERRRDHDRR